jgi:hypothetical protein
MQMKTHNFHWWLPLFLALCHTVSAADSLAARFHFIGASQLSADTNANQLLKIWNLTSPRINDSGKPIFDAKGKPVLSHPSQELLESVWPLLAKLPERLYASKFGGSGEISPTVLPLLRELTINESFGGYQVGLQSWSWFLGVRVTDERSGVWGSSLLNLFSTLHFGALTNIQIEGVSGWEFRQTNGLAAFRYLHAGPWCLLGMGTDGIASMTELVREINLDGQPKLCEEEGWLSGFVDLAKVAPRLPIHQYVPFLPYTDNPSVTFRLVNKPGFVNTQVTLHYPVAPYIVFEPWLIPTNLVKDPLIGLTAMQGIAPWLSRNLNHQPVQFYALPNQLFHWTYNMPFGNYLAMPVTNIESSMKSLTGRLIPSVSTNLAKAGLGQLEYTNNLLSWTIPSMELMKPTVIPISDSGTNFMLVSLIPLLPMEYTNPAPKELLDQIAGRSNLCYYEWELTAPRIAQSLMLLGQASGFYDTYLGKPPAIDHTAKPALNWLNCVAGELGNTITEARLTTPWDLTISRSSHLGLNSLEIVLLTRWLDSPDFPWPGAKAVSAAKANKKTAK